MRVCKKIIYAIVSLALSVLVVIAGLFPAVLPVSAEETSKSAYEQTNVLDDLKKSTIKGKEFDLATYNFDEKKETQILSFVEYCYSFYSDKQGNFGLYVYLYNPKGLKFNRTSPLNNIQIALGSSTSTNYSKYKLTYLNASTTKDYEGLFYKFRVEMSDAEKKTILHTLNSTERIYRVSGIELVTSGAVNATEYTIATTYKYSGYAAGYGSDESANSTLTCSTEQADVLTLRVKPTYYRPEGVSGEDDYTQDSLHSVYFAVPNEMIARYGSMSAIHATWLNAVLKPALVTGNQTAYNEINKFLGKDMSSHNEDLNYMYLGAYSVGASLSANIHHHGYSYNATSWTGNSLNKTFPGEKIDKLYLSFYAGSGTDSADHYTLSSEEILAAMKGSLTKYGGVAVNGKYSKSIFESVDSKFTDVNIKADETFSLTSQVVSGNFWQWMFGADGYKTTIYDGIKAIYPVTESDVQGINEDVSKRLYIAESDCDKFKSFYEENKEHSTVYLFRYQVSDYVAQEASLLKETKNWLGIEQWEKVDSNAYFFKETVNLDFDIIDVTFSNGETSTVIPVVSNPIDVVHDATPPVITTTDEEPAWLKWLKIAIILILLLVIVVVAWPIISPLFALIVKGIVFVITLPFKLIKKAVKKRKRKKEERKNYNGENG